MQDKQPAQHPVRQLGYPTVLLPRHPARRNQGDHDGHQGHECAPQVDHALDGCQPRLDGEHAENACAQGASHREPWQDAHHPEWMLSRHNRGDEERRQG